MRVDIVTIFPGYFAPLDVSLVGRARRGGLVDTHVHDLRRWTHDVHRSVDDAPYGGGPGMLMRPEPWWEALTDLVGPLPAADGGDGAPGPVPGRPRVIVPTPAGRPFDQALAVELAAEARLVFCCGRYEGIDARVVDAWATDEVSLGDYVLAGGEVATLVVLEAVIRLLPGVVGNAASVTDDSFAGGGAVAGLLEAPAYTRPPTFAGRSVPPVLLSGDHAAVARWRRVESLRRTALRRPDLLDGLDLSAADAAVVAEARAGAVGERSDGQAPGV